MKLICHRGIHDKKIKENTYESIKKALDSDKYIGVEFDVRTTKDNEFVIHHDPLCNGTLISNTLYDELPKYVPKLEDILKINSDKIFLIEIKNINGNINKFIRLLDKYKDKNLYVMSFNSKLMNKICNKDVSFKTGVLNYVLNTMDMSCLDFICMLDTLLSDELVSVAESYNKEIMSYGIINKNNIGTMDIYYIVDNELTVK